MDNAEALLYRIVEETVMGGREAGLRQAEKLIAHLADAGYVRVPDLTVRVLSFPESNGRRNWTAMIVRKEKWGGLIGNCGGITIARGELWNRVAYEAECARLLLGERETEPDILDYGDDIDTPDQWPGELHGGYYIKDRTMLTAAPAPAESEFLEIPKSLRRLSNFEKHGQQVIDELRERVKALESELHEVGRMAAESDDWRMNTVADRALKAARLRGGSDE